MINLVSTVKVFTFSLSLGAFYNCTQAAALNKQEVIPPHEDTLENLVSHLMLAWNSSRDLSVIFFTQDEHCLDY